MKSMRLEDMQRLAWEVLSGLTGKEEGATIVALVGDLGAGKTTFTQALARELGIEATVQSPTYILMRSYKVQARSPFARLVHIDAYRLENAEQFAALDPKTFLDDKKVLVVVEWPERVEGALPTPDVVLKFSHDEALPHERGVEVL